MVIRDARPDEALALAALKRRSSHVWEDSRAALAAHPDAIEPPHEAIAERRARIAVTDAGEHLGFAVMLPVDRQGRCELDDLFVAPGQMLRGVGRALVADAARRAAAAGASHVDVAANPNALGFYTRAGFEVIGEAETEFGPTVPRMTLDLHRAGYVGKPVP